MRIGGWLIVVGLGLLAGALMEGAGILASARPFIHHTERLWSNPHSAGYIPDYSALLKFSIAAHVVFLLASAWLLLLFIDRSRTFPRRYVIVRIAVTAYTVVRHGVLFHDILRASEVIQQRMSEALTRGTAEALASIAATIVWVCYMMESKRVKATFVN